MSMDGKNRSDIEKAKRALGSILNLIRYQLPATLDEAETRLRLVDEFAAEAFLAISDLEKAEFTDMTHTRPIQRSDSGRRRAPADGRNVAATASHSH